MPLSEKWQKWANFGQKVRSGIVPNFDQKSILILE